MQHFWRTLALLWAIALVSLASPASGSPSALAKRRNSPPRDHDGASGGSHHRAPAPDPSVQEWQRVIPHPHVGTSYVVLASPTWEPQASLNGWPGNIHSRALYLGLGGMLPRYLVVVSYYVKRTTMPHRLAARARYWGLTAQPESLTAYCQAFYSTERPKPPLPEIPTVARQNAHWTLRSVRVNEDEDDPHAEPEYNIKYLLHGHFSTPVTLAYADALNDDTDNFLNRHPFFKTKTVNSEVYIKRILNLLETEVDYTPDPSS